MKRITRLIGNLVTSTSFGAGLALAAIVGVSSGGTRLIAQQPPQGLSVQAQEQINALILEKASRTPVQNKINSQLLYAMKMARREPIAAAVPRLQVNLTDVNDRGVVVDVRTEVTDTLLDTLRILGADLLDVSAPYRNVRLRIDLNQIEAIAALPEVTYVQPKQEAITSRIDGMLPSGPDARGVLRQQKRIARANVIGSIQQALEGGDPVTSVGSVNSQGDTTHRAAAARAAYGVSGAGVKIGVLSNGVVSLALSQARGDLGPVTVLPGQTGTGDEGTAMLEIIHDLAPNAQLYFATASASLASFAANIRALRTAGCDIIVDDVGYFVESPFQDGQTYTSPTNGGIAAQAVKDVTAAGALYFSSAANSGNKNDGQSGTWEGDFVDNGTGYHVFGGSQIYDVLTITSTGPIFLFWSDPLGASANDYDLFRFSSDGTTILSASTDRQVGAQDPVEAVSGGSAGQLIVVVKHSGSARFLHLGTNRGRLQISTAGETHGHAATSAPNSFGVAATPAAASFSGLNPGPYPGAFNSTNKIETFSSDGPRRIFFAGNGAALTPGNVSATGGLVLQKPDFTAADGVSVTGVGGFSNPFYGTSAAAPHAAAIAGLVKSRNLLQNATQVRNALFRSAIDIEEPGVDRDSGIGIIMADTAVANAYLGKKGDGDYDGDGKADLTVFRPSSSTWFVLNSGSNFSTYNAQQWGVTGDIPVPGDYDGDGRGDLAIYRPANSTWWVLTSSSNYTSYFTKQWGAAGDITVPADYDGDGKTDIAVFRPSSGTWYVLKSSTNFTTYVSQQWGAMNDVPVARDYDGDGKADYAIFRPDTGAWWLYLSSAGPTGPIAWGTAGDVPVPGDYDGDGRIDLAIYRPDTYTWWVLQSSSGFTTYVSQQWGYTDDIPVPADFDGDGKIDFAVFRPSSGVWWIILSSTNTPIGYQWGVSTDIPVLRRP